MIFNPEIFKAYDIRGIYGQDFDEDFAFKLGQALVKYINKRIFLVGRDNRQFSEKLALSFIAGINSVGADAEYIGLTTTPLFNFAFKKLGVNGGVMLTASHLGPQFGGFKVFGEGGVIVGLNSGLEKIKIILAENKNFELSRYGGKLIKQDRPKLIDAYTDFIIKKSSWNERDSNTTRIKIELQATIAEELEVLLKKTGIEKGELVINIKLDEKKSPIAWELNLLTNKKFIYVLNASEKQLKENWQLDEKLKKVISDNEFVVLTSTFELLLSESAPEEQKVFLEEVGLKESRLDTLIKEAYHTLGLITFLTTGEDETRAWTCKIGTSIPQAARAIHTDFEQKFIRAEVISWQDLLAADSHSTGTSTELSRTSPGQAWSNARQSGKLRVVGRDYVVKDGDVIEIKI